MGLILAGTGHRPPRLGLDYSPESNRLLTEFVEHELALMQGVTRVISGMANGFDQALAHAALLLKLELICALPFVGQEQTWPAEGQRRYHAILDQASEVIIVSQGCYGGRKDNWKYEARDRWMVDQANLLMALLDDQSSRSGTRTTVEYAVRRGVTICHVWNAWQAFRSGVVLRGASPRGDDDDRVSGSRHPSGEI
jgi:uncharacterized phage-like protein YoqJ